MSILTDWIGEQVAKRSGVEKEAVTSTTMVSREVGQPIALAVRVYFNKPIVFANGFPLTLDDLISAIAGAIHADEQVKIPPPGIVGICDRLLPFGDFCRDVLGRS